MRRAVLAVGSNQGDRHRMLRSAVDAIAALDGVELVAESPWIETAALTPTGVDESAPAYLNGVVIIDTDLEPLELLAAVNRIEAAHGRVRIARWGDRTLDIDIVTMQGERMTTPELTLPHPGAAEREFVLAPWLAADPDAELPGAGRVDSLLARLRGGA